MGPFQDDLNATSTGARQLFVEKAWRGKILPSRLILAPINTGFVENGIPTARLMRFHEQRSGPWLGISMVGNVAVSKEGRSNDQTAVLCNEDGLSQFTAISKAIKKRGSLSGIQLASTLAGVTPQTKWRNGDIDSEVAKLKSLVNSLDKKKIKGYCDNFVLSANLAMRASYDVVQIHAAHGYLLSLLLNPVINHRTDCYSYSGDWFIEFIQRLRFVLNDTWLSVRLSLYTGLLPETEEAELVKETGARLAKSGVDIIDFSAGLYTVNRHLIYPGHLHQGPPLLPLVEKYAGDIPALVSFAGRVLDLSKLQAELPDNLLISVGRALIADPEFAKKWFEERDGQINRCALKGHCHYFSRSRDHLECGVNQDI